MAEDDPDLLPDAEETENELLADFFNFSGIPSLLICPFPEAVAVMALLLLALERAVGVPILPIVFKDSVESLLNMEYVQDLSLIHI